MLNIRLKVLKITDITLLQTDLDLHCVMYFESWNVMKIHHLFAKCLLLIVNLLMIHPCIFFDLVILFYFSNQDVTIFCWNSCLLSGDVLSWLKTFTFLTIHCILAFRSVSVQSTWQNSHPTFFLCWLRSDARHNMDENIGRYFRYIITLNRMIYCLQYSF